MLNMGRDDTNTLRDQWTVVTADGLPSVHMEHTLALTKDGVYIVTADEEAPVAVNLNSNANEGDLRRTDPH
jgi:methionyl aminopeptidase